MISAIRKWQAARRHRKPKYSQEEFDYRVANNQHDLMAETREAFRDMRLQLAEKENIINELKASKSTPSKPKRVQRHKQSRKGS